MMQAGNKYDHSAGIYAASISFNSGIAYGHNLIGNTFEIVALQIKDLQRQLRNLG